jgi:large subunit ribosomal protein L24
MKFKVGDKILVTAGKDKGRKSEISLILPKKDRVVVRGINLYTKHIKPQQGKPGEKKVLERSLPTASIAIINNKGEVDRIGYKVNKDGSKVRIYKKTGKIIVEKAKEVAKK